MNWDEIKGKWTELKGQAQSNWGKLSDDEWDRIKGSKDQLVGKLQQLYGKTREEIEHEVEAWRKKAK